MSVAKTCENFCRELRKMGFEEDCMTSIIPNDAMITATTRLKWSKITQLRYLGETGYLVKFGYLKVVEGGYEFTGEDLNE